MRDLPRQRAHRARVQVQGPRSLRQQEDRLRGKDVPGAADHRRRRPEVPEGRAHREDRRQGVSAARDQNDYREVYVLSKVC